MPWSCRSESPFKERRTSCTGRERGSHAHPILYNGFYHHIIYSTQHSMNISIKRLSSALLCLWAATHLAVAQTPLPKDAAVREGRLANGLTYYIRHNAQTPGQADFYIAQRVGSILEEPHQRGLAHFLEHMAFNGTKHFPDGNAGSRGIRNWCERNGIKFGADLNAYTSIDQTVYNISNVPVAKREGEVQTPLQANVDTCLLILSDWSHALLLKDNEIDQERGVIREEWRARRSQRAIQRLMENAMPTLYRGSKYEDCMPIGHIAVVDTFHYEALRSYYRKWYRPDLQAIIVVGDINVDEVERKVVNLFSQIPARQVGTADTPERIYYPVPNNDRMLIYTESDSEQPTVNFTLYNKREGTPRSERATRESFEGGYKSQLALFILRQRLADLSKEATPRLMSASVRDAGFYVTQEKDAFSLSVGLLPDQPQRGIEAAIEVIEKARRYGFTASELDHAKIQHALSLAHKQETKDKTRNAEYARQLVSHFCTAEHLMSIDEEFDLQSELEEKVTLEDVNEALREMLASPAGSQPGANLVCTVFGPTQWNGHPYTLPSHADFERWVLDALRKDYPNDIKDTPIDRTFMKKLPKRGKIRAKQESTHGYVEYLLSNGIKVYVRPSDIEPNRITVKMFRKGGRSWYGDEDAASMALLSNVIVESGAADFDKALLEKKRAGKALRVTPYIDNEEEGVKGVGAATDLKTWLEVMHLYLTQPRSDEAVFQNMMAKQRSMMKNRNASPNVTYNDSLRTTLYGRSERTLPMTLDRLDKVSLDRIYAIYKERMADLAGMNLMITGDVRMDEIEDLLTRYVASLPGKVKKNAEAPKVGPHLLDLRKGQHVNEFHLEQKTPSALTNIVYSAALPYTAQNDLKMNVLAQIMRAVYTEKVREEKGGTYGVSVSSQCWNTPSEAASLTINFRCNPAKYAELLPIIDEQLQRMAQRGPSEEQLQKVKEYELKTYERAVLTNGWWEYVKYNELLNGVDFDKDYPRLVQSLTPQDIQAVCRQLISQRNRIQVTMK